MYRRVDGDSFEVIEGVMGLLSDDFGTFSNKFTPHVAICSLSDVWHSIYGSEPRGPNPFAKRQKDGIRALYNDVVNDITPHLIEKPVTAKIVAVNTRGNLLEATVFHPSLLWERSRAMVCLREFNPAHIPLPPHIVLTKLDDAHMQSEREILAAARYLLKRYVVPEGIELAPPSYSLTPQ